MSATDLLLQHKRDLETCIAANTAYRGDRVGGLMLERLTNRAKKYLAAVKRDLAKPIVEGPFGTAGFWGENGKAPEIRAIIRDVERIAGQSCERRAA